MFSRLTKWWHTLVEAHRHYHYNRGYQYAWDCMLNGMAPDLVREDEPFDAFDEGVNAAVTYWKNAAPYERY